MNKIVTVQFDGGIYPIDKSEVLLAEGGTVYVVDQFLVIHHHDEVQRWFPRWAIVEVFIEPTDLKELP